MTTNKDLATSIVADANLIASCAARIAANALLIQPEGSTPIPPDPPQPTAGGRFAWNWCTPQTPTNWGNPLDPSIVDAVRATARMHCRHIIGWGPTENIDTLAWHIASQGPGENLPCTLLGCKAPGQLKAVPPAKGDTYDEEAPLASNFPAFANMLGQYAARYKPPTMAIWSEMRGSRFWNGQLNNRDLAPYLQMHDLCYTAIKAASPTTQISGPYVPVLSWAKGADGQWQGGTFRRPASPAVPVAVADVANSGVWGALDRRDLDVIDEYIAKARFDVFSFDTGAWTKPEVDGAPNQLPNLTIYQRVDKLIAIAQYIRARTRKPIVCFETYVGTDPNAYKYLLEKSPDGCTWAAWGVPGLAPVMTPEFVAWLKTRP